MVIVIGFFTDPSDEDVIRIVRKAATLAAPEVEFRVINLERRPDSRALESREFLGEISGMGACVIDADVRSIMAYSAEMGSLAAGMAYFTGPWGRDEQAITDLDRRVSLLTRRSRLIRKSRFTHKSRDEPLLFRYFADYYTIFSLRDIPPSQQATVISQWFRDTLNHSAPKIFVSYRSARREYATAVANSLRRRGGIVWFDEISIQPGDSIPEAINRGLGWCTHMVLIVDETFFDSEWTKAEYESVLYRHLSGRGRSRWQPTAERAIIPLFLVDPMGPQMPPMLQRIRGIDCRQRDIDSVTDLLWNAISVVGPKY